MENPEQFPVAFAPSTAAPIFPGDAYHSPDTPVGLFARLFPSLRFYFSVGRTVWTAGQAARAGKYDDARWIFDSLNTIRDLERVGVRIHIEGIEHFRGLPSPCVFIGNHMSTLETFVLPSLIIGYRDVAFVVKQSLMDMPQFGRVLAARHSIVVGRKNPREDLSAVLDGGAALLAQGISVVVFPQSTRSDVMDPALFNTIGVKLARRANVPVVPVALKTNAWGVGRLIRECGRIRPDRPVHFRFGPAMTIERTGKEEHTAIISFISNALREWDTP